MAETYIRSNSRDRLAVDVNLAPINHGVRHGVHVKDQVVLHETVSPDYPGKGEIVANAAYLAKGGLGIHSVIDSEGYLGWDVGHPRSVLYHTTSNGGNTNSRAIDIEQVSRVMLDVSDNTSRWTLWWSRNKQIDKVGQLLAFIAKTQHIPLVYSNGRVPGITTHWSVTKAYNVPGGHVDCWPRHLGGYYPVLRVIGTARRYHKKWYGTTGVKPL